MSAQSLHAQERCSRPAADSIAGVFPLCAVDVRPRFDSTGGRPKLAALLVSAQVGGQARMTVVLDSNGTIDRRRAQKGSFDHELIDASVRGSFAVMRFSPGRLGGQAVPTVFDLQVVFAMPADTLPAHDVWREEAHPWGMRLVTGREVVPRQVHTPTFDRATERAVYRAVLGTLLPLAVADSTRTTCIATRRNGRDADPDREVLAPFVRSVRALVPRSACPPSYAPTMMGPQHRPPGAIDPVSVLLREVVGWTDNIAVVHGSTDEGNHGEILHCVVERREAGQEWNARCITRGSWVS